MSESIGGKGIVYLVGAGPGDPGLITVRGQELLKRAQVIVYDYLSNPRLLDVNPRAEAIYVGKKAAAHSFTQDQINATLIEHGRAGKVVVRLKAEIPMFLAEAARKPKHFAKPESLLKRCPA